MTYPHLWSALAGASLIDVLRIASMIAWASVLIMLRKSVWRVLAGRPAFYDVLWSLLAGVALMVLSFSMRWYIAAESVSAYAGLYVYSILLAFLTVRAVRSYGANRHG